MSFKPDANLAREVSHALAARLSNNDATPLPFRLLDTPPGQTLHLPATAVRLLVRILDEMAKGNALAVTPVQAEITTQEAAELLNISRPTLIQLLDEGRIEFRKVGTHRRVRLESLMKFKRQAEADRKAVLAELAAYDQELGI
jgi:excisionase family DNA binding protein